MKILAIEGSGLVASCAVIEDDIMLGEYTTDFKKTHSETLLPMIDSLSKLISLDKNTIDFVAVSSGPGSFTGLRIGGTTAKGIAMALHIPIVSVPTLMGLSYNLYGADSDIVPLMDARRGEVYTGIYRFCKNNNKRELNTILKETALKVEDIIEKVNENSRPVIFLGDGVSVFKEKIISLCKVDFSFAPSSLDRQRASSVGALSVDFLRKKGINERLSDEDLEKLRLPEIDEEKKGSDEVSDILIAASTENKYKDINNIDDIALFTADDFRPQYLRMSQAERERLEKEKNGN